MKIEDMKPGMKVVRLHNPDSSKDIVEGNTYIVERAHGFSVFLVGLQSAWSAMYFEPAETYVKIDVTKPWFIRIRNDEEYLLVNKWLKDNFGMCCPCTERPYGCTGLVNTSDGSTSVWRHSALWAERTTKLEHEHEIKFAFKVTTTIESVVVDEVIDEKAKKIAELEETSKQLQEQIAELKKMS